MLPLYEFSLNQLLGYYSFLFIVVDKVFSLICFYPVGIGISLCILYWILYMCVISASIIVSFFKNFFYYFELHIFFFLNFKFVIVKEFHQTFSLLVNIFYFYGDYTPIRFLKRAEFYFFWFFIFCLFI